MKKKLLTLLLCAILLLGIFPVALAANYSDWFRSSYQEMETLGLLPDAFKNADLKVKISRVEICSIAIPALEKITGDLIEPERDDYFSDTKDIYVRKAFERGVVNGYTDGTFQPGKMLTRQEFFVVLVNFCNAASMQPDPSGASLSAFSDANGVAAWAYNAAKVCTKYGFVNGAKVGNSLQLKPWDSLTREEAIAMFLRCYKGLNEYYYYVKNAKVVAYSASGNLTMVGDVAVSDASAQMAVKASQLRVRSLPSTNGSVLGTLAGGAAVTVTGVCSNGWFRLNYAGKIGYVAGEYLVPKGSEAPPAIPANTMASEKAVSLANQAMQFIGYRYVYGGKSPSSGFDCSGLVYYVYCTLGGISMNRVADDQMDQGKPVDRNNLLAGDLVFFGRGSYADHVGIYIGSNNFVHASNPRSGVRVSSLSETYYANRYLGARRVTG